MYWIENSYYRHTKKEKMTKQSFSREAFSSILWPETGRWHQKQFLIEGANYWQMVYPVNPKEGKIRTIQSGKNINGHMEKVGRLWEYKNISIPRKFYKYVTLLKSPFLKLDSLGRLQMNEVLFSKKLVHLINWVLLLFYCCIR